MELNKNWKTWCSGRFMFNLPSQAKLDGELNVFGFTKINSEQSTIEAYKTNLQNREKELRNKQHRIDPSLLRKSINVGDNTWILTYWETPGVTALANIDGYRFMAGRSFLLSKEFDPTKEDIAIQGMRGRLMNLQPRGEHEIPSGPGFCIDRGFFPDEGKTRAKEKAMVSFCFQGHPDVAVYIDTLIKGGGIKLLDRSDDVLKSLGEGASQVQTIRSGDRKLGTLEGQEWLVKMPCEGGYMGHIFTWETQGKGYSEYPFISIRLETALKGDSAKGRPSSLTDEQALAMWEGILNSFKLHPTDGVKPETPPANPIPGSPRQQ